MPIRAPKPGNKNWTPAPEGLWRAVCCDVWMEPQVETKFGLKDLLIIVFQLEDDAGTVTWKDKDGNEHTTRFTVRIRPTLSVNKKSNLRKYVETWRGQKFASDDDAAEFDFEGLVGANCQVQIIHSAPTDDGTVYANINAIMPPAKGLPQITVKDYIAKKDRDEDALPF